MKHIFIINPTAGKSDSRQKIYDMADSLRQKHGLDVQCILTKKQGHATELAQKLCERLQVDTEKKVEELSLGNRK